MDMTAMRITIKHVKNIGRRAVDEYHLIIDDAVVATSHCVSVPADRWTLVKAGQWAGLVTGRENVTAALLDVA